MSSRPPQIMVSSPLLSLLLMLLASLAAVTSATDLDDYFKAKSGLVEMDAGDPMASAVSDSLLSLLRGRVALQEGLDEGTVVGKRVFCNGFTGCGGRHRGRRRFSQQAPETKRLFCNPYLGCAGGKRSQDQPPVVDFAPKLKRLFCNIYGGCRGGKRSAGQMDK